MRIEQSDVLEAFTQGPNRFEIGEGDASEFGDADDDESNGAHGLLSGSYSFRK